jgi:diguanylate cyclase (GGDEF)-like protein
MATDSQVEFFARRRGVAIARLDRVLTIGPDSPTIPSPESPEFLTSVLERERAASAFLNADGVIVAVNRAWHAFAEADGYATPDHGVGRQYASVCAQAQTSQEPSALSARRAGRAVREVLDGRSAFGESEYECDSPTQQRFFQMTATPLTAGGHQGVLVRHVEVTSRVENLRAARVHALLLAANERGENVDSHVLPNFGESERSCTRSSFERLLSGALALRTERPLAVVAFDVDDFYEINDQYGIDAAAEVIREIVTIAQASHPSVARLGAGRFALVLETATREEALAEMHQLVDDIAREVAPAEPDSPVTVSARIVFAEGATATASELMREVALALERARESGGANVAVHFPDPLEVRLRRIQFKRELREAIAEDQLFLAYQPVVELDNGKLVGCEALVRWNHPRLGVQGPDSFVPAAERNGLIVPLGVWVLRHALAQYQNWSARGLPVVPIAINVSAVQLERSDVAGAIAQALGEFELPPAALNVEITETVLISDVEAVLECVRAIRALGVDVVLDDFGTGYSSMSYLQQLPLNALKIDRSFVAGVTSGGQADVSIVRSMVRLAHGMDLTSVAEGVETAAQAAFLRRLGCDRAQGYYFGRPQPAVDFANTLAAGGDNLALRRDEESSW